MTSSLRFYGVVVISAVIVAGVLSFANLASAKHSWGGYHWARTSNPFTLALGDNVTSTWDSYLQTTSSDWSLSNVLDTAIVGSVAGKNCKATKGRAEICNAKYGRTGWLGIASIWISGNHITQGTVKLNDTYFNTSTYNKPAWRNLVMCQEVGHIFGLDHQDENFNNTSLGTCMDYSNDPTLNQHPNQHDYDMLDEIYAHLDTTTTLATSSLTKGSDLDSDDPRTWGREVRRSDNRRLSVFEQDLGNGEKIIRHVFWADEERNVRSSR